MSSRSRTATPRSTDEPMACVLHSNVGLMHGLMGIFNAWCDRMPILALGATGPVAADKRRPWIDWIHTAKDQGALLRNFTKWDDEPRSPEAIVEGMLKAYQMATTPPYGPVYVCLDAGLQEQKLDRSVAVPDPSRFRAPAAPSASEAQVAGAGRHDRRCEESAVPVRPRLARSRMLGSPCRAGRACRRDGADLDPRAFGVSDRSSAACGAAVVLAEPEGQGCREGIRPHRQLRLGRSQRLLPADIDARPRTPPPRSRTCRSTRRCTTAGAWTTSACRRSICRSRPIRMC